MELECREGFRFLGAQEIGVSVHCIDDPRVIWNNNCERQQIIDVATVGPVDNDSSRAERTPYSMVLRKDARDKHPEVYPRPENKIGAIRADCFLVLGLPTS